MAAGSTLLFIYPSHFSTSNLSLPSPLELREPAWGAGAQDTTTAAAGASYGVLVRGQQAAAGERAATATAEECAIY